MPEKACEILRDFNKLDKEIGDLYHDTALKLGLSDSAFFILYMLNDLGDGCLQKDICSECYANKQTINSSVKKLEQQGYLTLKQGRGRDKHMFLTEVGRRFVEEKIIPVVRKENEAIMSLDPEEREEVVRLTKKYVDILKDKLGEL